MTWLHPAEVTALRIRIHANAISTCSNWLSNFSIVMITPPACANLQWRIYVVFAVFDAAIIPCIWLFFPETGKRSLEEIDLIFAKGYAEKINPVKLSLEMPRVKGAEVDRALMKYLDHEDVENQRRASMASKA